MTYARTDRPANCTTNGRPRSCSNSRTSVGSVRCAYVRSYELAHIQANRWPHCVSDWHTNIGTYELANSHTNGRPHGGSDWLANIRTHVVAYAGTYQPSNGTTTRRPHCFSTWLTNIGTY